MANRVNAFMEKASKLLSPAHKFSPKSPFGYTGVRPSLSKPPTPSKTPPKVPPSSSPGVNKSRQSSTRRSTSPRVLDLDAIDEMNNILMLMLEKRQKLKAKLKQQEEEEKELVSHMKSLLKQTKPIQDPEAAFKKKSEEILEVFREETLIMDRKIYQLQEENTDLKNRIDTKTAHQSKEDEIIVKLFQEFEDTQSYESSQQLAAALNEKLETEKEHRKQTEKQAAEIIAEEEKLIASLKERLKTIEGKNLSESIELT